MYQFNVIQFLLSMDDHLSRIKNAEKIKPLWKQSLLFILVGMIIYGAFGYIGMGSGMLLKESLDLTPGYYESSKFWFMIGKVLTGLLFALFILFIPTLLLKWLTNISYKKLMLMQHVVLFVLLAERVIWFLVILTAGLDWYVSPLSLGIIASYATAKTWVIVFFGTISIFQIWVIWFQVKYISNLLENEGKGIIWVSVILLHIVEWSIITLLTISGPDMISGWFG